jgi:APA family basic amino acid/polyamine antiporter
LLASLAAGMSRTDDRGIGALSATALVAANMIGAGVFTTSGFALADLRSRGLVLLAWVVGGLVALCGALSYARLAERTPGNGGEYLYLSRLVHPAVGFLAGWVSLLAGFTAPIAVAAHGLEAYLGASFGLGVPVGWLGAGTILLAGLAHGVARAPGLSLQNAAVTLKLVAIAVFVILGVTRLGAGAESPAVAPPAPIPGIAAFALTLVWISFAYSGWNAAVYVAGELREPGRTLRRASLMGTLAVTFIYVALNGVFLYAAPFDALAGRAEVGAIAAEALGGAGARRALSAIVALGLATSISAMVMVGPRVYAQMADDGLLPRLLGSGEGSPRAAIAMQVGLALVAFWLSGLRELLLFVGFLLGLSAAVTVGCLFLSPERRFRMPEAPGAPLIFIVVTLGSSLFMALQQPLESLAGLATLAVGLLVYLASARR